MVFVLSLPPKSLVRRSGGFETKKQQPGLVLTCDKNSDLIYQQHFQFSVITILRLCAVQSQKSYHLSKLSSFQIVSVCGRTCITCEDLHLFAQSHCGDLHEFVDRIQVFIMYAFNFKIEDLD